MVCIYNNGRSVITLNTRKQTSCYCLKMRRASSDITRFYDKQLESSGVTVSQYSLLLNISLAEQGTLKELADMAELDRSTLARNIKPLIRKNLVYDAKVDGARNSKLVLTQEGIKTLEHAKQLWNHAQQQVQEKLGQVNISELEKVLKTLETL